MSHKPFFWLHIKKSAGITTRSLLQPYYVEVDRVENPKSFIQSSPEEYNDILNNFKTLLGEYQFRRTLFAKTYLYSDQWDDMVSFAFSREPLDRCVSMFHYLYWRDLGFVLNLQRVFRRSVAAKRLLFNTGYAFDAFLDLVEQARTSGSMYRPMGLHFTTHTAPVWHDITDLDGNILLTDVFRLEDMTDGINRVFEKCGIEKRLEKTGKRLNQGNKRTTYQPTKSQAAKIENIYFRDFDIYEQSSI